MSAEAASSSVVSSANWLPFGLAVFSVVMLIAGSFYFTRALLDPIQFPVSKVEIHGESKFAQRRLVEEIVAEHGAEGFYGMSLNALRADLRYLPWVSEVTVRRVWPDTLKITLRERTPLARWNESDLVSTDYTAFSPHQLGEANVAREEWQAFFTDLPRLYGRDGRHAAMVQLLRAADMRLARVGDAVSELQENDRRSVTVALKSGVTLKLGREAVLARLDKFCRVYARVVEQDEKTVLSVDMRYPNGFAIRFGGPSEEISGEA